jgi:hypothetical protein
MVYAAIEGEMGRLQRRLGRFFFVFFVVFDIEREMMVLQRRLGHP